ncbi:helix-turn-helix domain-containing protein [Streptomyces durhamensis]|uniref:helix-turn-helix domain-containing protein n=1 Tax=Streptomyces durhamensis TaxID=68194 RepID=UPI003CC90B26
MRMTHAPGRYTDFERPNAKDDLRAKARELRLQGWTYDQIEAELGCSRSSVSLWVRDLPRPERKRSAEQAAAIARKGWEERSRLRDEERRRTKDEAKRAIGALTARELFLVGVGLYWAEGGKDKPYDRRENVAFVNSDPGMIEVFLAWLDLLGVERGRLRFTVMIHETADVGAAERYWADFVGATPASFNKTTIKKHNPKTVRKNTGEDYRGCLVIKVLKGADLYRRIEGSWCGIVEAAREADQRIRT